MQLRLGASALVVLVSAGWLACSSFASDDTGSGDDGGTSEASVEGDAAKAGAFEAIDVPAPTELLLHDGKLYIAGQTDKIYAWTPGTTTTQVFSNVGLPARGMGAEAGNLYFIAGSNAVYIAPLGGADAGAAVVCRPAANALAVASTRIFYATSVGVYLSAPDCINVVGPISPEPAPLLAAEGVGLLRYQPTNGGEILRCADPDSCGSSTLPIATMVGMDLTAMIVDDSRVYWATPTAVFSKLKSGGSVVTLATDQKLPKALATIGGALLWTNYDGGTLMRAPVGGGSPAVQLAGGIKSPWGLVVTGEDVFVSASGGNRVLRFKR